MKYYKSLVDQFDVSLKVLQVYARKFYFLPIVLKNNELTLLCNNLYIVLYLHNSPAWKKFKMIVRTVSKSSVLFKISNFVTLIIHIDLRSRGHIRPWNEILKWNFKEGRHLRDNLYLLAIHFNSIAFESEYIMDVCLITIL